MYFYIDPSKGTIAIRTVDTAAARVVSMIEKKKGESPQTTRSRGELSNVPECVQPREQAAKPRALAKHAELIRKLGWRVIADVIEVGRRLSECKQIVGHGSWLPWLKREFSWSERTARNFINVYEFARSKSAKISDLAIDISSVYLLAAPSTPEDARDEVLSRLEAGEVLPLPDIQRIVSDARGRKVERGIEKHRVTIREVKHYYRDFLELSDSARAKILEERPADINRAIQEALVKERWAPPHRELQNFLEAFETLAKRPMKKIVTAIPAGDIRPIMMQVESAKNFLTEFDAKLRQYVDAEKIGFVDDHKKHHEAGEPSP
jgi:hypothetical protein